MKGFSEREDEKLVAVRDDFQGKSVLAVPVLEE
jgi:hypothetical protein